MATSVLDLTYLSQYLSVPQPTLSTAVDAPTAELVRSILEAVTKKAREHEELNADKIRLDIELENAVRTSETRSQGLKNTVDKALKDVEDLRQKLNAEENQRSSLESELQILKSSSSTSTSEVENLRARISSLEAANRDAVAVLETKTTANDTLSLELQKQHQKGLHLNQQISTLQQTVQTAQSAVSSAKFREQTLQQELDLSRRNNEWIENELKTKSAEALKFRKEKGTRIAELQRQNEEVTSSLTAAQRTEQILRTRLDEVQKKVEDSLSKIQGLQEAAAKTEEGFRQELESAHRLADLQAQQTETHRNRLYEVEASLERVKDDAADEVGRCRQEAEAERQGRELAENKIAELEAEIDQLQAAAAVPNYVGSVPGTPRGQNGGARSPMFGTPGSARKTNITATQALNELYKAKAELAAERRRNDKLAAEMDEMVQGLEAKQPEIEELQNEHERLQQEMVEMSRFVDQSGKERDQAKKDVRKAQADASTAIAESNILRQQLRDLSLQVKMLLCDLDARERGLDNLSMEERTRLERLARGEVSEDALDGMSDTDRLISERLTVFRSVSELQEKNQELLRVTRQLGAQMESEEALAAKSQAAKDHEEVQILQSKVENYKDELRSMVTRSESYIKERDMFRRMLQHRGQLPANSDLQSLFGQSVDGPPTGVLNTVEGGSNGKDNANYAALLRELQGHFDQYREEQAIDRRTLKEQSERLASEKGALQSEISKISSQLTLANERYEMLHANYTMLQNENSELQKRSRILSESAAKQDLKTQQVAEDLIEAKGLVESMRNENANLKAEKKLWKDIQDRLNQDNENLMNERSRLNGLITSQQNLQNEREMSVSETRRRLQTQVESLETELHATKRQLTDEVEENKKAQLRKEYDTQQTQKRLDDLVSSLGSVREELVAAKTTRDHLQARVDELTIELKSAEERVEVLQPKPTARSGTATNGAASAEETITHEQELAVEVSELKRDLELAKAEIESAKIQMEQYRAISQSSEEELQSINETQDQYREEMDRIIQEKDAKIKELHQRVDDISAELTNTNNELTTLRNSQSDIARRVEEEKAVLESEIARLKDEDERHATAAQFHQQDLRAQAEIATKAQQDYENELVKHAEAAKLLQTLRVEYNQLKSETVSLKTEAESAKVALSQSESSFEERRGQFERELAELCTRRDDIDAQNRLLHKQLESVGAQIAELQKNKVVFNENGELESTTNGAITDRSSEDLRELAKYLRREKEIVDVQYDLSVQEGKRLRQQMDYTQSQLDETRLKLDQERRAQADGSRSSIAHKDLMEKLNELNLFRESSITLRNEARQAQAQLAEKTTRVEELLGQIQPLETKIRELENSKEIQEGETKLLQEDRDRWQKRTQDILSKYDRIDPAEMEQLKESLASLQAEKDALITEQQPLQVKIQALEAEKASWAQSRQRLIEQSKEKVRSVNQSLRERTTERDTAIQEKEAVEQQLSTLRQELETTIQEKQSIEQFLSNAREELESAKSERDQAVTNASQPASAPVAHMLGTGIQDTSALDQALSNIRQELATVQSQKAEIEAQLDTVRSELAVAKEPSVTPQTELQQPQANDEQLIRLQQELESVKSERDQAKATAADAQAKLDAVPDAQMQNGVEDGQIDESSSALSDAERKSLRDQIGAAEARAEEAEARALQIEESMETTLKARSDKMKTALNKKLVESRDAMKATLEAEYNTRLEQDKKIWLAENEINAGTPVTSATLGSADASPALVGSQDLSDIQVRELLSTNPTIKSILASNLKKKLEAETQKLKEEQEKILIEKLAEVNKKAEDSKAQAVIMESKKSALKLNMTENRAKAAAAKIAIVETAAKETPQKPVVEVWEAAKNAKPVLPAPAAPAVAQATLATNAATTPAIINGNPFTAVTTTTFADQQLGATPQPPPTVPAQNQGPRPVTPAMGLPRPPGQALVMNGTQGAPAPTGILSLPLPIPPNVGRGTGIPMPRGGAYQPPRGRGISSLPQRGGNMARGRSGSMQGRGGMNAGAQSFSPNAGNKRPMDPQGAAQQGGKRQRGGGPIS